MFVCIVFIDDMELIKQCLEYLIYSSSLCFILRSQNTHDVGTVAGALVRLCGVACVYLVDLSLATYRIQDFNFSELQVWNPKSAGFVENWKRTHGCTGHKTVTR